MFPFSFHLPSSVLPWPPHFIVAVFYCLNSNRIPPPPKLPPVILHLTLALPPHTVITINVPVVYMARYVMVLRRATSLWEALEGVGPENRDFFGPWNGNRPKKVSIFRAHPSNAPSNDVVCLKTIKYKRHINNRYIGNLMYTSVVALLCVGM